MSSLGSFALASLLSTDWCDLARRWVTLQFLAWRFEVLEHPVCRPPASKDLSAAALFAGLGGRKSVSWCCANAPLGLVLANSSRVRRLCEVLCGQPLLLERVLLPKAGVEPLSMLDRVTTERVVAEAWHISGTLFDEWRTLAVVLLRRALALPPSTPLLVAPSLEEAATPMSAAVALPRTTPQRVPLSYTMLQYRQLLLDALHPPMLDGLEDAGPVYREARRVALQCADRLDGGGLGDGAPKRVMAVLLWGDPTRRTALHSFEGLVPGGHVWRQKQSKLRLDLSWAFERPTAARVPSLYWHDGAELLYVYHCERLPPYQLHLDVVKGSDFRDVFAPDSPERLAVRRWEDAVAVGTVDALLSVKLNKHYTFGSALYYGMQGYENRHGHMHLKHFSHDGMMGNKTLLFDGRVLLWRNSSGEPLSPKRALIDGLLKPFAPFAASIYYASVQGAECKAAHPAARIMPDLPFSYLSCTIFADAHIQQTVDIPGLSQMCNSSGAACEANVYTDGKSIGKSKGMDLHRDRWSGFTIVLVLGVLLDGFAQLYPTCGVGVPLACWAWTSSNARDLLCGRLGADVEPPFRVRHPCTPPGTKGRSRRPLSPCAPALLWRGPPCARVRACPSQPRPPSVRHPGTPSRAARACASGSCTPCTPRWPAASRARARRWPSIAAIARRSRATSSSGRPGISRSRCPSGVRRRTSRVW